MQYNSRYLVHFGGLSGQRSTRPDSENTTILESMCLLLIRYGSGEIRRGVLMAIQGNELRVAAEGCDDILAFRLQPDGWVSENLETVTFELPTAAFEALEMDLISENTPKDSKPRGWGEDQKRIVVN